MCGCVCVWYSKQWDNYCTQLNIVANKTIQFTTNHSDWCDRSTMTDSSINWSKLRALKNIFHSLMIEWREIVVNDDLVTANMV